jgi:hypothetical protein
LNSDRFINDLLQSGNRAIEKVNDELGNVSLDQLNWKPSAKAWSIAECLEHLIISNTIYFPTFTKIGSGSFVMSSKEKFSPLTRLWGIIMKDAMKEQVRSKMRTHKTLVPVKSDFSLGHLSDYSRNCSTLLNHISECRNVDLKKTIITSPVLGIVTYSLWDVFTFLITHQHRHINQAIRVKHEWSPS